VDKINIDRSFVSLLGQLAEAITIAQAMISMEHPLSVTIAAEGVESPKLAVFLAVAGVDGMQGTSLRGPAPPTRSMQSRRRLHPPCAWWRSARRPRSV
jgi:EAL domain-containing protein (putative c-di-GMP-specific phosphodiesterase class I)